MNMQSGKARRWRWPLAGIATALLIGGALEFAPPPYISQARADEPQITAQVGPVSFADVVAMARPAVVNISVTKIEHPTAHYPQQFRGRAGTPFEQFFQRFFQYQQQPRKLRGQGSGFVIDPSGYIVTNNHVTKGANKIVVTFQNGDKLDGKLVGHDPKTDLALIKVDPSHPLPTISWGNSDKARIGDWVLAIGNPYGLGGTATAGIISARGRNIRHGPYDDYLQIDAPINPGNSGGPLLNVRGQVIGINTAIYTPNGGNVGIGFAIPSNQAASVIAQLKSGGEVQRGWLGIQIQTVNDALAKSLGLDKAKGALVANVVNDSPAAAAGFKVGDVIKRFGGETIKSARDLSIAVSEHQPGDEVEVKVWRDGDTEQLSVELGDASSQEAVAAKTSGSAVTHKSLGLALAPLTDQKRSQLGLPDGLQGVLVAAVDPNGPAAEKGIQAGDVVTAINRQSVTSVSAATAAIKQAKQAGSTVLFLVRRGDAQYFVAMKFS